MTSNQSDSESNVSGFIRYNNDHLKFLYKSMLENMQVINQDVLEIEKNMRNIVKKAGPLESQLATLLQSFPKPDMNLPMETDLKGIVASAQCGVFGLSGNWVEDLIECPKTGTYYFPPKEDIDYDKLRPETRKEDFRVNRLDSGRGNVVTVIRHSSHDACGNYATINDLVYNHLPKPLCGPNQRYYKKSAHQFYPQPDLMKCFGNATEWGLRKYMQQEWACAGESDYMSSLYDDTYVAPLPSQYLQGPDRKARNSKFTKTFRYKMTNPVQKKKQR